jgi:uncharacterized membrane protein HdeD (DUF308 family)
MTDANAAAPAAGPLDALRAKSGWVIALGVISVIGGLIALSSVVTATLVAVLVVGAVMIVSGVTEVINAVQVQGWGKSLLWGALGFLYIISGLIVLNNPFVAAKLLTLVLSGALIASGILRIRLAFHLKSEAPWVWVAVSGALTILLGLMIFSGWPLTGFYALGMLLGIDLVLSGAGWIATGLALKRPA